MARYLLDCSLAFTKHAKCKKYQIMLHISKVVYYFFIAACGSLLV